jgi:hypothetical protein
LVQLSPSDDRLSNKFGIEPLDLGAGVGKLGLKLFDDSLLKHGCNVFLHDALDLLLAQAGAGMVLSGQLQAASMNRRMT